MRKGLTEVIFILDRSGSMSGLEKDTIGGFNSLIERQKKEDGEAYISVVLFDDRNEVLYDRVSVDRIEPMNDRQYFARGCTALLDAIGGSVHHMRNVRRYTREEDRPEKTLFIITTDGQENSSREYSYHQVKEMIESAKTEFGWEFLFLGANMNAIDTASRFGIRKERAFNYHSDHEGTKLNYQVLDDTVAAVRKARDRGEMGELMEKCCMPIQADYESRRRGSREKRNSYVAENNPE